MKNKLKPQKNHIEEKMIVSTEKDKEYPFEEEVCSAEFPQGCIDPKHPKKAE